MFSVVYAEPQLSRLGNGIPVIVLQTPGSGLLTIQALIRTDDLSPAELGELEYFSGALFGETESFSLQQFRRLAWLLGGHVTAEPAGDVFRLEISTDKNYLQPAVSFLVDAIRRPLFSAAALKDGERAYREFQETIDTAPPFRSILNRAKELGIGPALVQAPTEAQARALHLKVFRPERMAIAVVGDVESETIVRTLSATLGGWEPELPERVRPPALKKESPAVDFAASMAVISGPTPKDSEFAAWMVFCTLLAKGKGSILGHQSREIEGSSYLSGLTLLFRVDKSFAMPVTVPIPGSIGIQLRELIEKAPITDAAVVRAKAFLLGQYKVGELQSLRMGAFAQGHSSPSEQSFWLAWWELHSSYKMDAGFMEDVGKVAAEQIRGSANKWLSSHLETPPSRNRPSE